MTVNTDTSVTITWTLPYNGGSTIDAFNVQILSSDGEYYEETTYCNARYDMTVISTRTCVIPMSYLMTGDFNLEQGNEVVARVLAVNIMGDSPYSAASSSNSITGALIMQEPHKPL